MKNKQPVYFMQTDPRWRDKDYSARGEHTTIGRSGCGPSAMSMVLATWADPSVTPETECAWALRNGFKAPHSGTYYGYFVPAGKRYGLEVTQLNWENLYGNKNSRTHKVAKTALDRGGLVIACMGKGTWTRSGHYVLVWKIDGNTVYINDPASTAYSRIRGNYAVFRSQVKYYWVVKRPYNIPKYEKEDEKMTAKEILESLKPEDCYDIMKEAMKYASGMPEPAWSLTDGYWAKAKEKGVINGEAPERPCTRVEAITMMSRMMGEE